MKSGNMIDVELFCLNLLPQKENINLHVFSTIMKYWIVSYRHNFDCHKEEHE